MGSLWLVTEISRRETKGQVRNQDVEASDSDFRQEIRVVEVTESTNRCTTMTGGRITKIKAGEKDNHMGV